MSSTLRKAAPLALLLIALALLVRQTRGQEQAAATEPSATTQHAPNAMKVGWVVSLSTFEHPSGHGMGTRFDSVTAVRKRFLDPEVELFALIEPGTESSEDVVNAV